MWLWPPPTALLPPATLSRGFLTISEVGTVLFPLCAGIHRTKPVTAAENREDVPVSGGKEERSALWQPPPPRRPVLHKRPDSPARTARPWRRSMLRGRRGSGRKTGLGSGEVAAGAPLRRSGSPGGRGAGGAASPAGATWSLGGAERPPREASTLSRVHAEPRSGEPAAERSALSRGDPEQEDALSRGAGSASGGTRSGTETPRRGTR